MSFIRYDGAATEYQGKSFTKTLLKKDGIAWLANKITDFELVDKKDVVQTGNLTKVNTNLGLKFEIQEAWATALLGNYLLIVYLRDTVNVNFADIIARYSLTYLGIKAES